MTIHFAKLNSEPWKLIWNQGLCSELHSSNQSWICQPGALADCHFQENDVRKYFEEENNYPPSTTSKVVLENENEPISPDLGPCYQL